MEWTQAQRYRKYQDWDAQTLLTRQAQAANSPYQVRYHFGSPAGLINDPNGFSYYNHQWHLFFQHFPFGAAHGLKSWGHLVSDDLVHWRNLGLAIAPDTKYDSHGAYSGSAAVVDDKLFIMYSGNHRDENWHRTSYQVGALMDKHNHIKKLDHPLILPPENVTEHFRDPQLIKQHGNYYVLLGAQDKTTMTGQVAVYRSHDLQSFDNLGYLDFTDEAMGYMIECPNLVLVDDKPLLIFCPQGLNKEISDYDNIYPNMYLLGENVNLDATKFTSNQKIANLDDGFDVYATQAFNAPDGHAYAISWVGLPDVSYPTDDSENWQGVYSQVKRLSIVDGKLIQRPVPAMANLRQDGMALLANGHSGWQTLINNASHHAEMNLDIAANQTGVLHLVADKNHNHSLKIKFDTTTGKLVVDRSNVGITFAEKFGQTRSISLPANQAMHLEIFWDGSLAEIFVNGGRHVMTLRYFAKDLASQTTVGIESDNPVEFSGTYWKLKL